MISLSIVKGEFMLFSRLRFFILSEKEKGSAL